MNLDQVCADAVARVYLLIDAIYDPEIKRCREAVRRHERTKHFASRSAGQKRRYERLRRLQELRAHANEVRSICGTIILGGSPR